jgi:hypothetical protein
MKEDDFLCAFRLEDRLGIAAVDLAVTGTPRALVEAVLVAVRRVAIEETAALD